MDDLQAFRAVVLEDAGLQQQLLAAEEPEAFGELASRLANERGIDLSPTDIRWALDDARRTWSERIIA
jgi:Nif11 domain